MKPHPEAVFFPAEEVPALLAALEACLERAEQISRRYQTLVVEPGGVDGWHVPQVRALGALDESPDPE